jgi:biopolymer transport protein ExbD
MVFQLITFFMLVVTFKTATVDLGLNLPVLGTALPEFDQTDKEIFVVNVRKEGALVIRGAIEADVEETIRREALNIALSKGQAPRSQLSTIVVVRADRELQVDALMRVVDACRANGFQTFDFVVMRTKSS